MAQKMKKNNLMKNTPIFRVFFVFLKTMLFFAKNFAKNKPEPSDTARSGLDALLSLAINQSLLQTDWSHISQGQAIPLRAK